MCLENLNPAIQLDSKVYLFTRTGLNSGPGPGPEPYDLHPDPDTHKRGGDQWMTSLRHQEIKVRDQSISLCACIITSRARKGQFMIFNVEGSIDFRIELAKPDSQHSLKTIRDAFDCECFYTSQRLV